MRKGALRRSWPRIAITLAPLLLLMAHASGLWHWSALERLDDFLYDTRLAATMPGTPDPRIVIVDIDESSLRLHGQWPWDRSTMAELVTELTRRQQVAALGFDVVFAEPDGRGRDNDRRFAQALTSQPVALGYYFTRQDRREGSSLAVGELPAPLLPPAAIPPSPRNLRAWNDFGANIPQLSAAAVSAGFINSAIDAADDGVLRKAPLIANYNGSVGKPGYYESLGLALYRLTRGRPEVAPVFVPGREATLQALVIGEGAARLQVPVDPGGRMLVPFRGLGGANTGTFRYIPAASVLAGALRPGELRGKIALLGSSAPGLQDLQATPVSATFPGAEVHANVLSALLDGRLLDVPDYALGYNVVVMLFVGLALAFGLSLLSVPGAVLWALLLTAAVVGLNVGLYLRAGLVLPLAEPLILIVSAFMLNMSWGAFVESRGRRRLAGLFGSYVPPELVQRMLDAPQRYSMRAESRELTVMFCDIRGFTALAEQMAPQELQHLLNTVFSRLTEVIGRHGGTIDKYMGDCIMAFWGAPIEMPRHALAAVRAAQDMLFAMASFNASQRNLARPEISLGIGLNTGLMSVGDMGTPLRRSYTVIGDAVNLAARFEGLGPYYDVAIVAGDVTRAQVPEVLWQPLDRVRVRGRAHPVEIFTPIPADQTALPEVREQRARWEGVLQAYRSRQPEEAAGQLAPLLFGNVKSALYQLYAQRIASMRLDPPGPNWDGSSHFESK